MYECNMEKSLSSFNKWKSVFAFTSCSQCHHGTYRGTRWPCHNAAGPPEYSHGKACHVLPYTTTVQVVSWPYIYIHYRVLILFLCLISPLNCLVTALFFKYKYKESSKSRRSLQPTLGFQCHRPHPTDRRTYEKICGFQPDWDGIIQEIGYTAA